MSPPHIGGELSWEDAERVTRLIKKANPKRVVVERYARTRCPHTDALIELLRKIKTILKKPKLIVPV